MPSSNMSQDYRELLTKAGKIHPKVDQKLLLNILYYNGLQRLGGNVLLKVVYPADTDVDRKKDGYIKGINEWARLQDRTVRFKAIRFYLDDLNALLAEDPDIEFVTGSATLNPSEAYSAQILGYIS